MQIDEKLLDAQDINQQGVALLKLLKLGEAQLKFEKAIELEPMLVDSYKNLGDLNVAKEQYEEAKKFYKKAMLIEKKGEYYFLYGNACFLSDNMNEGIENYKLAISNGYDSDEMMMMMGIAYENINENELALRYFQKAHLKNPSKDDYLVKKISVLIKMNQYDEAEISVDELLENSSELYDGYHMKTQILMFNGKINEAITFAKNASEKFPADAELLFDYAKCLAIAKRYSEVNKIISAAKEMAYFAQVKNQFMLLEAQVAAEERNIEKAINVCEVCLESENESYKNEAKFMLLSLHLIEPNYKKTLEFSNNLISSNLGDNYYYAALYYRPFCLSKLNKEEDALKYYKEANMIYRMGTLKNPGAVDLYIYRCMCLRDLGDYDKAFELLEFIENLDTGIAEIHTLRADIYDKLNNTVQAKIEREKAFKIKPELRELFEKGED